MSGDNRGMFRVECECGHVSTHFYQYVEKNLTRTKVKVKCDKCGKEVWLPKPPNT